jgi:hypothetical protein
MRRRNPIDTDPAGWARRLTAPRKPGRRRSRPGPCKHCRERMGYRARGLCWSCYHTPAVLELYPPQPKGGLPLAGNARGRPAAAPTAALPGTPEKLAVLAARAAAGEHLWHPRDAGGLESPTTAERVDARLRLLLPQEPRHGDDQADDQSDEDDQDDQDDQARE